MSLNIKRCHFRLDLILVWVRGLVSPVSQVATNKSCEHHWLTHLTSFQNGDPPIGKHFLALTERPTQHRQIEIRDQFVEFVQYSKSWFRFIIFYYSHYSHSDMHRAIIIPPQPARVVRPDIQYGSIKPHIPMNIQTVILHREYEKHPFDTYRGQQKKNEVAVLPNTEWRDSNQRDTYWIT